MAKSRPRSYSVRVRILGAILVVTAVGLALAGSVAFLVQQNRVLAGIDDELRQEFSALKMLVEQSSDAPADGTGPEAARSDTAQFTATDELVYEAVRVIAPPLSGGTLGIVDGEARYVSGVATTLALDSSDFVAEISAATASGQSIMETTTLDGREVRYLAVTLSVGEAASTGLFVAAIDIAARLADLNSAMTVYAWVAIAALIAVALVGAVVAGRLLHPVRELRRTAARITAGALDERIPVTGNDDLSELTETINAMIARLEDAFLGQRRVLNDVRHELATPVTIIRGHIDMVDRADPGDVAQTLDIVAEELDRMTGLIAQIADLADAERAAAHSPRAVDIGDLTRSVFDKARALGDHEWRLGRIATGDAVVDPTQLTQAWLQLADNAAKHSPAGSWIEIGSAMDATHLRCWVADGGPGIPESARTRIFERFGRAEASRGTAGSGLGLSIVQALTLAHGGRIELDTVVGRGSIFTMVLPRRGAAPDGERTAE